MKNLEKKELLEEQSYIYLGALQNSNVIGRDESSDVYLHKGILIGMCRIFDLDFVEKQRRKISFYKRNGKLWFEIVDENFSEEQAIAFAEYRKKEYLEQARLWSKL